MISVAKRAVILIVEDELLIRLNAVEMIKEAFEVVEAASADEAIAILEGRLDIAVVFTDIQMPGSMDGMKLAAAVRHAGLRLRSWPLQDKSNLVPAICRRAGVFCQSPTVLLKS
jgi:CheY-like chemotaxis protein